ncbi:alpha/beta hydrolase-fold protein [Arthrobacter sp. BE255]|uniref:alpha/beta hydrolase n=1 Tax=Arthrobacter sp. BE255 TaxID=2817721 RepID=UPI002858A8D8|nr:alpha/beta hydrolase-fold protein [Arthrobacter sp. BE255]MDR7157838.1 enterochelin esterase-like enzyme [Arthrobacter sp. BE255]
MDFLADVRLTDGPVFWTACALGAASAVYLLWRPASPGPRPWWLSVLVSVAGSIALIGMVHWALIDVFSTFPEDLPDDVLLWSVPAVAALILVLIRLPRSTVGQRSAGITAFLLVLLLSAVQINAYFGLNRTVSDLMGTALARIQALEPGLTRQPGGPAPVSLQGWTPQGQLPGEGALRKATIPGPASELSTREAYIYLPPAYFAANRPALPVLVLFSGQPGGPSDWLTGGALRTRMDEFASSHGGVAPVVVVADPNGTQSANTLCLDSRIARADTYLAVDVPAWISATLDVDPSHTQWAAGGFSFGATCALQMGTRHPDIYSSVLAFSSELEPALAKERQKTIDAAYAGDTAAFERETPLSRMNQQRFDSNAVYFAAGERDPEFVGYMATLADAARKAGFTVEAKQVQHAGHSWDTPSRGMEEGLAFLAARWGIQQ